jgi:hypothetical protein
MDIALLIISILSLITIGLLLYLYINNEKKNKAGKQTSDDELKQLLTNLSEKTNAQISSSLEKLFSENISSNKELKEKISLINTAFDEYAKKVQATLAKYSEENIEAKKSANLLKEQIQKELTSLLIEIKAPLDLD